MTKDKNTRAGFDLDLLQFQAHEANLAMVLMSNGTRYIEHKCDMVTVRSRNLFVEYSQPSGPSGIATTTSDSWAFEYDEGCWLIVPTNRLKAVCRVAYERGLVRPSGDHNRYQGVILPIRWLIPPYTETSPLVSAPPP